MGFFSFRRQKETTDESAFTARAADGPAASRGRSSKRKESEPVDPVLPEKQRARRRLVGAVALVLAAVIGLPMILDPEPKPLAHDIAIDIPSKEKSRKGASAPATAALDAREEIMETASVAGAAGSKAPGAAGPGDVPSAAISVEAQAPADSQKAELAPTPKAGATGTTKADAVPAVADAKPVAKRSTGAADDARARSTASHRRQWKRSSWERKNPNAMSCKSLRWRLPRKCWNCRTGSRPPVSSRIRKK
jgi:DedD protein